MGDRLDPELLDERAAAIPVRGEGIGLPARAIESEHQLTTKSLAERVISDELLELDDRLRGAAERQARFAQLLDACEPQLLQACDLPLRKSM